MDILYLLIPLSVVLVFLIGYVFWWSLKTGMFDDLEGPGHWILHYDDNPIQRDERPRDSHATRIPLRSRRRAGGHSSRL